MKHQTVRISYDTEFNTRGVFEYRGAFDLISVGMVNVADTMPVDYMTNCGFYAVSSEFDWNKIENHNDFVRDIVLPRLYIDALHDDEPVDLITIREGVKAYLREQILASPDADTVELWAKNGTMDEFVLCQIIFDDMGDLYDFMSDLGIKQTRFKDTDTLPKFTSPSTSKLHNALYDAIVQAKGIQWCEKEFSLLLLKPQTTIPIKPVFPKFRMI
jgi:hypothetical protein